MGRSGQNHFLFLYLVSGVHGKAPGARYEISALKEPQCVLETLFTVFGQNLWIWRKQNPAESDQVILAHLNAGSSNLELEDGEDVVILRTDVAAATEWRHGDGVGVNDRCRCNSLLSLLDKDNFYPQSHFVSLYHF